MLPPRQGGASGTALSAEAILEFLHDDLSAKGLRIGKFLSELDVDRPFFFVAATGLGKTVGVPLHLLAQRLRRGGAQRVWVVVPTVLIATDTQRIREHLWREWWRTTKRQGLCPPLYGCITRPKSAGRNAPVLFVSTGIFALLARNGEFDSDRDTVIIDEAHKTLGAVGDELARRASHCADECAHAALFDFVVPDADIVTDEGAAGLLEEMLAGIGE